jgi:mono/diheme cytochrome c family protein
MARGCGLWIVVLISLFVDASAAAADGMGDPGRGRALFIGARRLTHGGPPCGACHAIGGASAPFAAALGPELSASFDGLPHEAIDGLLTDLPFPTMAPLYAGRALTPDERADLESFFAQVSGRPPPSGARVAAYAAVLAVACLSALLLAARRRTGSKRASLRARPPRLALGGRR